jgi:hypothetical protein
MSEKWRNAKRFYCMVCEWFLFEECEQSSFVRKLLCAANVFWVLTLFTDKPRISLKQKTPLSLSLVADFSICSGYHQFCFLRGL